MIISDLSCLWLCRIRTMFWPTCTYRLLDFRSSLTELSLPMLCPWKIFIWRGETSSLLGRIKFLVVGSKRWLSCCIAGENYAACSSSCYRVPVGESITVELPLFELNVLCSAIGDSEALAAIAFESNMVCFV